MSPTEELSSLHAANRRAADAHRERKLVSLRASMFTRPPALVPGFPVTPGAPDGTRLGVPACARAELSIGRLREAMITSGALHVRGLLDPGSAENMRGVIDAALEAQEASHGGASPEKTAPWYEPQDLVVGGPLTRTFVRNDGAVLAVDSPRGLYQLLDTYYAIGIDALVEEYFGERPALSSEKTTLRRAQPLPKSGEWHQDGRFLGSDIRSLNLWVALTDCPAETPGGPPTAPCLELVATRLHRIVQTGTEDATFEWTAADALVQREFAGKLVRPQFKAGDALFFDHFLLHRTWRCEGMTRPRYALETWFFAPSAYPDAQTGIYV